MDYISDFVTTFERVCLTVDSDDWQVFRPDGSEVQPEDGYTIVRKGDKIVSRDPTFTGFYGDNFAVIGDVDPIMGRLYY